MFDIVIITPSLNAAQVLDATIWSVVSQYGALRVRYHVQDGASTDGSQDLLAAWQERLDKSQGVLPSKIVFSFSSEPDFSMYDAIDKGVKKLEIEGAFEPETFMNWLNAGDIYWPEALKTVVEFGHDLPCSDWVTGYTMWRDEFGSIRPDIAPFSFPTEILQSGNAVGGNFNFVQQESTFWRKRLWDSVGGIDTSFRLAGDWDLWRRMSAHCPLITIPMQLGVFTFMPKQLSITNMAKYLAEVEEVVSEESRNEAYKYIENKDNGYAVFYYGKRNFEGNWEVEVKKELLSAVLRSDCLLPGSQHGSK